MRNETRPERQRLEILAALAQGRLSHALGLAFEHFGEFGQDPLVSHLLWRAVVEDGDEKLFAELGALLARAVSGRRD